MTQKRCFCTDCEIRLQDKIEDKFPKENKSISCELLNPIILLERPKKEDLVPSKYIHYMCHNNPDNSTSGKYVIEIPRFDSGKPGEWIIFVDLVQKALVGQNVITDPPMYKSYWTSKVN